MTNNFPTELLESLKTGFIDKKILSKEEFRPEIIINNREKNIKVLTTIERELKSCEEFWFSVAFVTKSGVATLINRFEELKLRGIKGKILVSQYLNFTEPEALKTLLKFENIELKIVVNSGYHAKGYLFKRDEKYNLIIGSSNFTATAFSTNIEWNLKVSSTGNSYLINEVLKEFEKEFENGVSVTEEFIKKYEKIYKKQKYIDLKELDEEMKEEGLGWKAKILPNSMQQEALKKLDEVIESGEKKALIISATGTGKTYLSAFHVKKFNPKKFLFIVHRENIAKAAKETFQKVFGDEKTMGLYSGSRKGREDYLFSTVQTLSKEEHLKHFDSKHFDYIVIDETHRVAAESYQKIIKYFKPKFLLGMTATPERTDNCDIFKEFDHNVAYEIRLQKALEEEMLVPFHYYGVTDIEVGSEINEEKGAFNQFSKHERVDKIIEKAELYGCDNGSVRGLVFCSKIEEATYFSEEFNRRGYRTVALSGANTAESREEAIKLLEGSSLSKLDYIFTVDIFNEGIDIPKVNQIIMLRGTESPIVFIQQLGRGLRKAEDKDHLTVIDFIGNYKNNYLIPIALFGDTSYNKDNLRNLMVKGNSVLPGSSTINFDKISKERIFQSIDQNNINQKSNLLEEYKFLKGKIGRIPFMVDFLENSLRDPYTFVEYSKSYYHFLELIKEFENSEIKSLNEKLKELLRFFSENIGNGKRIEEVLLLKLLISNESKESSEKNEGVSLKKFKDILSSKYLIKECSKEKINSILRSLNFEFIRKDEKIVKYLNEVFIIEDDFRSYLKNSTFKIFLLDILEYGERVFCETFKKFRYVEGFFLYKKYSRKDVCRILNWDYNEESTVYGYKIKHKSCPLFINYHKDEDIDENIAYDDHFEDRHTFNWMSKSNRKLESSEIKEIRDNSNNLRIPMFIKKHNGESSDFYYMGDVTPLKESFKQDKMANGSPVVKIKLILEYPVEEEMYEYITKA